MQTPSATVGLALIVFVLISLVALGLAAFGSYTGLARGKGFLAMLAAAIGGGVYFGLRTDGVRHLPSNMRDTELFNAVCAGLSFVLITAFVLRLWSRWVGDQATHAERLPGREGVRAWFSASNVAMGVAIALSLWCGFDYHPLFSGILLAGILAAYPLIRLENSGPLPRTDDAGNSSELSAEREKILAMLEAGKLTPEESAELLQALGSSSRQTTTPHTVPMTQQQRLVLVGAALALLGFFLPWFTVDLDKEAQRLAANGLNLTFDAKALAHFTAELESSVTAENPSGITPAMNLKVRKISVSGGKIDNGLGWLILALALIAACIPYVAVALDAATMRTIRLLCLAVGSIVIVYLLSERLRYANLGIVMVVGGYALEIAGMMRVRAAVASESATFPRSPRRESPL